MSDIKKFVEKLAPTRFEKVLHVISPSAAMTRMNARHRMIEFEWRASNPGKKRGGSGGRNRNATTQSPTSQRSRINLMWEARKAYRNMPVISCVVNRLAEYVVPQIRYQANTGDPEADIQYEAYWNNWATHEADVRDLTDFEGLVKLAFIHMLIDGDIWGHPIHTENSYAIQLIEGDRVGNPDAAGSEADPNNICGIHLDESGRPVLVEIYGRDKHGRYTKQEDLPANQVLPLMSLESGDQVRGVTLFCRVIDQVNDLYETFEYERGACKWAASQTGVIYEKDERSKWKSGGGASEFDGVTEDGTPTQSVVPNKLLRLFRGESVESFPAPNRPSGAFINLIDATLRDIAMGVDLPFGFFDMRGFGGATSRLEAHQIQRKINAWQNLLRRAWLNPIRDLVINKAILTGQLPQAPNPNHGTWTFGPHITADLGYQTNADILLLQHNLVSAKKLAAAQGYDYDEVIEERGNEIAKIHEVAIRKKVPIEMLNPNFQNGSQLFADIIAAESPPPRIKPTIQEAGDKVSKQILELINNVAEGTLPREEAIQTLIYVYQMPPKKAQALVPQQGEAHAPDNSSKGEPATE